MCDCSSPPLGDAQSRRKRTSTHEWVHEWHYEWAHEWAPTSGPTRAPTTGPTRVDFPVFSPSRTPAKAPTKRPTKASTEVPTKVSSQVVEVHLSCFHLFCSSATALGTKSPGRLPWIAMIWPQRIKSSIDRTIAASAIIA